MSTSRNKDGNRSIRTSLPRRLAFAVFILYGLYLRDLRNLAEHAARTIPGSQSMIIASGGHLVIASHFRQVGQRIQQFLSF